MADSNDILNLDFAEAERRIMPLNCQVDGCNGDIYKHIGHVKFGIDPKLITIEQRQVIKRLAFMYLYGGRE